MMQAQAGAGNALMSIRLNGMMDAPEDSQLGIKAGSGAKGVVHMMRLPPPAGKWGVPGDLGPGVMLPGLGKGALTRAKAYPQEGVRGSARERLTQRVGNSTCLRASGGG